MPSTFLGWETAPENLAGDSDNCPSLQSTTQPPSLWGGQDQRKEHKKWMRNHLAGPGTHSVPSRLLL